MKWEVMEFRGKKIGKEKKNTNDHKMKIKLEGLDGRTGTVKNRKKKKGNKEDKTTKMKTKF